MIKPLRQEHLRAFNTRNSSAEGLLLRAEYCDFMARGAKSSAGRKAWELCARRRRQESAEKGEGK